MDPALNPYTPGSGRRPPSLQGRDQEIDAFDLLVAKAGRRIYDRGMMLTGLRGVGKTALLNSLRANADHHNWFTVPLEAQPSGASPKVNYKQLASGLKAGLRRYSRKHTISQLAAKVGDLIEGSKLSVAGVSLTAPTPDEGDLIGDLEEILETIGEFARKSGTAVGLFIDEIQDLDPPLLAALVVAQHRANQEDWPFYLIGAGLPNVPAVLGEARSYAERLFLYRTVGPLTEAEARAALSEPATQMGGSFAGEALDLLVRASEGYPYFLQEFGKAIWDAAPVAPFTIEDAEAGLDIGRAQLDQGFFPSRWDRATPAERRYLRAIAETNEPHPRTSSLSIPQSAAGPVRASLIKKGIVYSAERGRIGFTVPGMAGFIARQPDEDE
ncbi:ATP-binding protein [Mycolicibacterium llatzerense]|uniref:ATP-binding protein n=1 Tax=Mycolicibacterium llatzerense TaxID=280871 RepID=UPI0008DC7811|nr:ATP-binding protein [Mycolicibacterium llatzerense]